jgi:hypothetical protein
MFRHSPQSYLLLIVFILSTYLLAAQHIGDFQSVQPTAQTEQLVLPSTHRFQYIIHSGTNLTEGGQLGSSLDFTGYVPIAGSSRNGYLSISSESFPAECSILSISFDDPSKTWKINNSGKVNFPFADVGNIAAFCSGSVTPKHTVMVCEETTFGGDGNGDGYEDLGWIIEIDPATKSVINQDGAGGGDKLWSMGRQTHEDLTIKSDQSVVYYGADADPNGYIYKYVPTLPGNYSSGLLYVLKSTSALGTGTWELVSNSSVADRNNTVALSTAAGAYNFKGIEGVALGPDNRVYFAAKYDGIIYRFHDLGTTVDQLSVFVSSTDYDVDGAGPFAPEPWGLGNDNLAFDGDGNLWVLQDGDRNHIWVVGPSHSAASPDIRLFATTPAGCEPTGIAFTPDYRYMFLSIQHPFSSNTTAKKDAAGNDVVFNTHTTVVIARSEFLGSVALPLRFTAFDVAEKNRQVNISWTVEQVSNHKSFDIERSLDGIHFETIYTNNEAMKDGERKSFTAADTRLPPAELLYYRIRECDKDEKCVYTAVKPVKISGLSRVTLFPLPATRDLTLRYTSILVGDLSVSIVSSNGVVVRKLQRNVVKGLNEFALPVHDLPPGQYILSLGMGSEKINVSFTKM